MNALLRRLDPGPWLFGPRTDLLVFGGSVVVPLLLVGLRRALGADPSLPDWGWLVFVLGIDVAHVYATLFRTYLDGEELRRHPARYAGVPVLVYAAGVSLYLAGGLWFWRVLAYVALFHFVRQQVGWAAVYRARDAGARPADAAIDAAAIYLATLYPILVWHADPGPRPFSWFVEGDFAMSPALAAFVPAARLMWVVALGLFAARAVRRAVTDRVLPVGRLVVVFGTAAIWYVGIVQSASDFDFTVTNVVAHGVPYVALLYVYARARDPAGSTGAPPASRTPAASRAAAPPAAGGLVGAVATAGFGVFATILLGLAFFEELAWDRWVFGDRPWLFGAAEPVSPTLLAWLVPLLAVPQATHYVLDGLLWRRRDTRENPAQQSALGFRATGLESLARGR